MNTSARVMIAVLVFSLIVLLWNHDRILYAALGAVSVFLSLQILDEWKGRKK